MPRPRPLAAWILALLAARPVPAQENCGSVEPNLFPRRGTDWSIQVLRVLDGPGGSALFAGGQFTMAGGTLANRIVRFDGRRFEPLGGGVGGGSQPVVHAIEVFDDGAGGRALYVAGTFTRAGGRPAANVARWDGTEWHAAGSGVQPSVRDLLVHDDGTGPALFAAGRLRLADGTFQAGVLRFDGSAWSVYTPLASILDLEIFDDGSGPALVAAAQVRDDDGVYRWRAGRAEPGVLVPIGEPFDSTVWKLAVFDDGFGPALHACGDFTAAGGVPVARVARFDGSSWAPLGAGLDQRAYVIAVADDGRGPALFAGGNFVSAGGVRCLHVARWDGMAWSPLGSGIDAGGQPWVLAIASFDDGSGPSVHVGGNYTAVGGLSERNIARWRPDAWTPVVDGLDDVVLAWAAFDDGRGPSLYAAGRFRLWGGVVLNGVGRWTDEANGFVPVGSGLGGTVSALAVHDDGTGPALYAGGVFPAGAASNVARFDGTDWRILAGGPTGDVHALISFDDGSGPALYAGGRSASSAGSSLVRLRGSTWESVGQGSPNGTVTSLAEWNRGDGPALYAGGIFYSAGASRSVNVARWDGSGWSGHGTGRFESVSALQPVGSSLGGPGLVAAGQFQFSGSPHVALWDGTAWRGYAGGIVDVSGSSYHFVSALAVFDDGSGDALYAGGQFEVGGASPGRGIARTRGVSFESLLGGAGAGQVSALWPHEDRAGRALFAGGYFETFGGVVSSYAARYSDACSACRRGTVNAGAGPVTDVLFVNDSSGGATRTLRLATHEPLVVFMQAPPTTGAMTPFALFGWRESPGADTFTPNPLGIGGTCLPTPLTGGEPRPAVVWNNTGKPRLGPPTRPSFPAPSIVVSLPGGFGRPATFFLQGIIRDPGSAASRPASVTNGVLVEIR